IAKMLERAEGATREHLKALRDATHLAADTWTREHIGVRWMTAAAEAHDWTGCVDAARYVMAASGAEGSFQRDQARRGAAVCLEHDGAANQASFASFGDDAHAVARETENLLAERARKQVADRTSAFADECMYLRGGKSMKLVLTVQVRDGAPPRVE